jgi:hypothetical protein
MFLATVGSLLLAAAATTSAPFAFTLDLRWELPANLAADPETKALVDNMRSRPQLSSRVVVFGNVSRQEILSGTFVLPRGAAVLHKVGETTYTVTMPEPAKTYAVLDANTMLQAIEGGLGVDAKGFDVKIEHTAETKLVGGLKCKLSRVQVTWTSMVPFEHDRLPVPQQHDVEVWHTTELPAASAIEHIFLVYRRDATGNVIRRLAAELGFPMDVTLRTTQGKGAKARTAPGALRLIVRDVDRDPRPDFTKLELPPPGHTKTESVPFLRQDALKGPGGQVKQEDK